MLNVKKYLKKHLHQKTLSEIAKDLSLSEAQVKSLIIKHFGENKLHKLTGQKEHSVIAKRILNFNMVLWLQTNWCRILILVLGTVAVYFNSLNNGYVSDDVKSILENRDLRDFNLLLKNPFIGFLRPLLYYVMAEIFGKQPISFRLLNIGFHLGTVLSSFLLLTLLLNKNIAFMASLLFSIHPIETEAVSWISGGPYSQAAFFMMLTIIYFLFTLKSNRYFIPAILVFLLSLSSSEKSFVVPFIILLMLFLIPEMRPSLKKLLWLLIPGMVVIGWLIFQVPLRRQSLRSDFYLNQNYSNPLIQLPVAITSYLELTVWPLPLTLYHSEMVFSWQNYLIRLGFLFVFLGLIGYTWIKKRVISFWLLFFLIVLSPTLTPFGVSWVVAERYVYLATLGIFVAFSYLIYQLMKEPKLKIVSLVLFSFAIFALSLRTVFRNRDWKNQDTLWLSNAKNSPSSIQNHNNLGDYYFRMHEYDKAINEFKIALNLHPGYADAYHNLGNVYYKLRNIPEAKKNYEKAIAINPKLWPSYQNLAGITFEERDWQKCEFYLNKAEELMPNDSSIKADLAVLYANSGRIEKAKEYARAAISLDPNNNGAATLLQELP